MTTLAGASKIATHHHGFFDGFTGSEGASILAAIFAAAIAMVSYTVQRKIVRRSERADLYGNAIGAVEVPGRPVSDPSQDQLARELV